MKSRQVFFLILCLCIALSVGCSSDETSVEGLCLDENFDFSLPKDGSILFDSFISVGFDHEDYVVIKYSDLSAFDKYEWTTLTNENISEIETFLEHHNESRASDKKEPIPEEYMPDFTKVIGIRLSDPPDENGFYNEQQYSYIMLDAEKLYVYVVVYCP